MRIWQIPNHPLFMVLRQWSHQSLENRWGELGGSLAFLFGQAAKISDNVALCANLDQWPFTGVEEALSARPPANSYMTPAPAYQSKPLWMVFICTQRVNLATSTYTARAAGAFKCISLFRPFLELLVMTILISSREDRRELFDVLFTCRKTELKDFDTRFVHKLFQNNGRSSNMSPSTLKNAECDQKQFKTVITKNGHKVLFSDQLLCTWVLYVLVWEAQKAWNVSQATEEYVLPCDEQREIIDGWNQSLWIIGDGYPCWVSLKTLWHQ